MKRYTVLVLSLLITLSFSFRAYALSPISIEEIGLEISFTDDYLVRTRDNINGNNEFEGKVQSALGGYSEEGLKEYFYNNNIYLDATSLEDECEIMVSSSRLSIKDIERMNQSELDSLVVKTKTEIEKVGDITSCYIKTINNIKYVVTQYNRRSVNDVIDVYGTMYSTYYNGRGYSISVLSYNHLPYQDSFNNINQVLSSVKIEGYNSGINYDLILIATLSGIVALSLLIGAVLFIKNNRKKRELCRAIPIDDESKTIDITRNDTMNDEDSIRFCRRCGTELPTGSEFCHKCGTRVIASED